MLSVAAAAGLVAALTDRLIGPGVVWWHWCVWPVAGALAVAGVLTLLRRQSSLSALIEVDTSLRLHDRLGSALSLEQSLNGDPFIAMTVDEAERAAASVNLARAVPIRWGRSWSVWPVLIGLTAAVGFFVQPMRLLESRTASQRIRFNETAVREASETIRQALDSAGLEPSAADAEADAEAEARHREMLDRLMRELDQGRKPPEEALAGAAGVLEDAAKEAETRAAESQAKADELRRMLSKIPAEPEQASPSGSAEPNLSQTLRESLRQGDLRSAADALEEIEKQLGNMPRDERERLSRDLEELSRDLREQAERQQAESERLQEETRERLQDQGLPPDSAEQLAREAEREAIEQSLREQGLSEDAARRLSEQLEKENRQREAEKKAAEEARKLSEAAKNAADEAAPRNDQDRSNRPEQPESRREPGDQNQQQSEQSQGQEPRQDAQQRQQQQQRDEAEQRPNGDRQQQEQSERGQQSQGQRQSSDQQQSPGMQSTSPEKEKGDNAQQSSTQRDRDERPADGQPSQSENPSQQGEGQQPGGLQNMRQVLEQMQQQQSRGGDQQRRAEELRNQAREMLEKATPEERERMMQWARQQAQESGGSGPGAGTGQSGQSRGSASGLPFRTDEVDVRRTGENERVAAEWTRPGVAKPDRSVSTREFEQQLIEAREAAQQAMEEQNIPARYRNVQEFYRRALKKADEPKPAPRAPAPAAEDAAKKP